MTIEPSKTEMLDRAHVSVEEGHKDPLTETQDGLGPVEDGHTQQVGKDPAEMGAQPEPTVVTKSSATQGRHVKHTPGDKVREARHNRVERNRRESEKAFDRKKK
jgi:hypothetical protein